MRPTDLKRPATQRPDRSGPEPSRARRRRWERAAAGLPEIPQSELTPTVQSAVMRLMGELDRLRDELMAAHERVEALESAADEDPLVPVLNRRGFVRELERTLAHLARYGGSASLVYVDLDGFKTVNDSLGHAAGDAVLRAVAEFLVENVRKSDIVGRLGGDEFAIVLHFADAGAAEAKAAQLMALAAETSALYEGRAIPLRLSAGATGLAAGDAAVAALERADRAMYRAKIGRRGGESLRR